MTAPPHGKVKIPFWIVSKLKWDIRKTANKLIFIIL